MKKRKAGTGAVDANRKRRLGQEEASQEQSEETLKCEDYTVGWICALPVELAAALVMRDEKHGQLDVAEGDTNSYVLGRIAAHGVVMTCLPQGTVGTNSAATVATNMTRSFPRLRFILMVGVGAGAPDPYNADAESSIRLGDVVVSKPNMKTGGVIQYDFGKTLQSDTFENGKPLNKPPPILRAAVAGLEAQHLAEGSKIGDILEATYQSYSLVKKNFQYPGQARDYLFQAEYEHVAGKEDCYSCELQYIVPRQPRDDSTPVIHYGLIGSANQVMRDALKRESMRKSLGMICFEMEAAGLMDDCPCLVIRGICDYADSHKNKEWQPYAALTAAAYAKELLSSIRPSSIHNESIVQLADILRHQVKVTQEQAEVTREHYQKQDVRYQSERDRACHRIFKTSDYERQKNINPNAVPRTCRWVFHHPQYLSWSKSTKDDLLWISADPGCGKSVLSKSLIDIHLSHSNDESPHTICYFFFKDNQEQNNLSTALCAILHQIFSHQPQLIHHALPAFDKSSEKLQRDVHDLWRVIQSVASDARARPITCVLDALDECQKVDRELLIDFLCQSYGGPKAKSLDSSPVKWLVTSRPYDDVRDRFGRIPPGLPSIHLRGEDETDQIRDEINLVIHERVRVLSRDLGLSTETTEELLQQLLSMEHRTYLWLYLAIEAIKDSFRDALRPSDREIIRVPASVEEAYERILARVNSAQRPHAKTVLTIIVGARRPLTIEEMALALDVATLPQAPASLADLTLDPIQLGNRIRRWCGLFVLIADNKLYLLHQTAKEFLLNHEDEITLNYVSWKHCLPILEIEKKLATVCIRFLRLFDSNHHQQRQDVEENAQWRNAQRFFNFAAEYWASYAQAIEDRLDKETWASMEALYDPPSERQKSWMSAAQRVDAVPFNVFEMNRIQLAAFNGHNLLLKKFLENSPEEVDVQDSGDWTALTWASAQGHHQALQTLLDAGADVNGRGGVYAAPLEVVSDHGDEKIV